MLTMEEEEILTFQIVLVDSEICTDLPNSAKLITTVLGNIQILSTLLRRADHTQ